MSDIDLIADAREWLATQSDRPQTHGETCHRWHPACLVARLISRAGQSDRQGENLPERDNAGDTPEAHATPAKCSVQPDESTLLSEAIRRLAEQDATLSVVNGNVIVQIDATLTAEERRAIREAADAYEENNEDADCERIAATLRGLLERTSACGNRQ
jgi:hypothetical protein